MSQRAYQLAFEVKHVPTLAATEALEALRACVEMERWGPVVMIWNGTVAD
ncbi:MAG TPA: hypothetical protein VE288_16995 [Rubrobacteraceae bacterium]|nr:hypothetical protein [Rubrobacteraceae bacterium]